MRNAAYGLILSMPLYYKKTNNN